MDSSQPGPRTEGEPRESKRRKLFLTLVVIGTVGALAAFVSSAAFTATTDNPGNRIESGSVVISDSDGGPGGGVLYNALNQEPGSANGPAAKCIRVTYGGSLSSNVRIYRGSIAANTGDKFQLKIERGSGITTPASDMNCTGFTPDASNPIVYDNTLGGFGTAWGSGSDGKAGANVWNQNDTVDYRFTIYTIDDPTPNARTTKYDTGTHSFTWEARNN